MMTRKSLYFFILFFITTSGFATALPAIDSTQQGAQERQYLVKTLVRIADPVLTSLSRNELKKLMPVESSNAGNKKDRSYSTHLEAFARLLAGMAPWLELGPDNTPEGQLRKKYIDLAIKGIHNATDPKAPDFMNFNTGRQPVVDAAFFAHALLRAPKQLWGNLDKQTQANVIEALKSSRVIQPSYSNWLLFSSTIEAALMKFDNSGDRMRMDYAVKQHLLSWYKGDGAYGDGPNFHWDYYNSFVIQPMLVATLKVWGEKDTSMVKHYKTALARIRRYAVVQERMISPEGTYPIIGRSLAYRFGAFQALADVALMRELDKHLKPQQVRAALYTMIKRQIEAPNTFDKDGWLRIGIYGHQVGIAESYISTGSLYLCSEAFLILGLPEKDEFWQGRDEDWTTKKVWKGLEVPIDHASDN